MGFQKKQHQSCEGNGEKTVWVIAGIPLKAAPMSLKPLRPITTTAPVQLHEAKDEDKEEEEEGDDDDLLLLQFTPKKGTTAKVVLQQQQQQQDQEEELLCPPAPKKARPPLRCRVEGVEFFDVPEDLASVFMERS